MTVQWGPEWPELYLGVEFIIGSFIDISSYVRSLDIVRPTSEETGTYSPAMMTVVLDNRDGRFSASNLSGPYMSGGATLVLPEITVRYVATWDSVDYRRFTGMVEDWVDEYPENGEDAVTVLTCVDHLARFAQWTGSGAYTSPDGATSGDIVTSIADSMSLDLTWRDIETGDETHAPIEFTGNGLDLLHDLCDSEGGAVWWEPRCGASFGLGRERGAHGAPLAVLHDRRDDLPTAATRAHGAHRRPRRSSRLTTAASVSRSATSIVPAAIAARRRSLRRHSSALSGRIHPLR